MLDALKVLFILTGASTYLVTKYVKVDNKNSSLSKMRIRVKDTSIGKTHFLNIDSVNNTSFDDIVDVNGIDDRVVKNYNNDAERDVNFDAESELEENSNNRKNGNKNFNFIEFVRPLYVINVVEEDDRDLPKLLLQVSAPHNDITNSNNINRNHNIINDNNVNNNKNTITYSLNTNNGDIVALNKLFFINSTTGELFLIRPLDRDLPSGKPKWKYSINAKHFNTTNPFAFADVVINVKDINDNKPFFTEDIYHANISENGPTGLPVIQVSAIDYDDSNDNFNGKVTYSIAENHFDANDNPIFGIDSETGVISTLICCIDREMNSQFILRISASDGEGLSGSAKVVVTIDDQNDCLPKFRTKNRTIEIDDSISDFEEDEEIISLYVSDEDLIESNHFVYEIVNCTNCGVYKNFYILTNPDGSGSLMAKSVDNLLEYTRHMIYHLVVSVSDINDTTDESHKDYAFINIIVNNSNDKYNRIKTYFSDNNVDSNKSDSNQCSHCHNDGICIITGIGYGFRCQCMQGFTGVLCDETSDNQSFIQLTDSNALICGIIIGLINIFVLISTFILYTRFRSKSNDKKEISGNGLSICKCEEEKLEECIQTEHNCCNIRDSPKKMIDDMREFVKPAITYTELTTVVEMSVFDAEMSVFDADLNADDEKTIAKKDFINNEKQLLIKQNQTLSCGCIDSGISDGSGERPDIVVGCAEHLFGNTIKDININTPNTRHVFITDIDNQLECINVSDTNDVCVYNFDEIPQTSDLILRY